MGEIKRHKVYRLMTGIGPILVTALKPGINPDIWLVSDRDGAEFFVQVDRLSPLADEEEETEPTS